MEASSSPLGFANMNDAVTRGRLIAVVSIWLVSSVTPVEARGFGFFRFARAASSFNSGYNAGRAARAGGTIFRAAPGTLGRVRPGRVFLKDIVGSPVKPSTITPSRSVKLTKGNNSSVHKAAKSATKKPAANGHASKTAPSAAPEKSWSPPASVHNFGSARYLSRPFARQQSNEEKKDDSEKANQPETNENTAKDQTTAVTESSKVEATSNIIESPSSTSTATSSSMAPTPVASPNIFSRVSSASASPRAEASEPQNKVPEQLISDLKALVTDFYPRAKITNTGTTVHFEYKVKKMLTRSAREATLPMLDGIMGDIKLEPGRYSGDKALPREVHELLYSSLMMAPYSEPANQHLLTNLLYTTETPPSFLERFKEIIKSY